MALQIFDETDTIDVRDDDLGLPNPDHETVYTIRPITSDKNRELIKAHTKRTPNPRTRQMDSTIDYEAYGLALWDYVLVGWTGIVHRGHPVPCEGKWKRLLDAPRREALLQRAGANQPSDPQEETAEDSFRQTADVV